MHTRFQVERDRIMGSSYEWRQHFGACTLRRAAARVSESPATCWRRIEAYCDRRGLRLGRGRICFWIGGGGSRQVSRQVLWGELQAEEGRPLDGEDADAARE